MHRTRGREAPFLVKRPASRSGRFPPVLHLPSNYPGIRLRMIDEQDAIREHIKIFVNQEQAGRVSEPPEPSTAMPVP